MVLASVSILKATHSLERMRRGVVHIALCTHLHSLRTARCKRAADATCGQVRRLPVDRLESNPRTRRRQVSAGQSQKCLRVRMQRTAKNIFRANLLDDTSSVPDDQSIDRT